MRIGLISDIHSNLPALEAVLQALARLDVAATLGIGDLMCYGAHPGEVLATLRENNIPSVMGNYDEAVAFNRETASRKPSSPRNEPLKRAALKWTQQAVNDKDRAYLRSLPWMSGFRFAGQRVHLLHAGLDHLDEWVAPDAPESLRKIARHFPNSIVALGHSHQQFTETLDDVLLVNPGAVGRSLDGDTRAAFAVVDVETRKVDFHRIAYPLEQTLQAIKQSGMPEEIASLIGHGARRIEEIAP